MTELAFVPETEPDHPVNRYPVSGDSLTDTPVPPFAVKTAFVVTPLAAAEKTRRSLP